jgi:heme-based aerotactic transducer
MSNSSEYGRENFAQGGLNDQVDVDSLVREIGLDGREIQWRKEFIGFDAEDAGRPETYQEVFAENAD